MAYWIMLCDKHGTYIRRQNMQNMQKFWQRVLLICGDMGCESTKLLLFDTHEENFNSGQKGHVLFYCDKAPDSPANLEKWMRPRLAPNLNLRLLQHCCVIRIHCVVNNLENDTDKQMEHPEDVLAVSAIVQCPIRRFLPSMFMLTDAGPQASLITTHTTSSLS